MVMNKLLMLFSLLLISCSSSEIDDGVYSKSTTVELNTKSLSKAPWSEVQNDGSDLALLNSKTKSYFLFNSACRKYESSNLNSLTASILSGISDLVYIEKANTTHQDREAMLIIAEGNIDGVSRFFQVLTTQKNNCIYDYALIANSKKNLELDAISFKKFINLIKLK